MFEGCIFYILNYQYLWVVVVVVWAGRVAAK